VVAYGILHHLVEAPRLVAEVYKSLRPGGLFWISDIASHETAETVLLAGLLAFLLPTYVPYREKIAGLLKFGFRIPARVRASMQSEGASPFEGVGRETEWPEAVRRRFTVERLEAHPAVTGYIASQVNLPDRVALPILHALQAVDSAFVRSGLLRSTGLTVYARKPRSAGATR
jgi:SAM-dependent methyltransferase